MWQMKQSMNRPCRGFTDAIEVMVLEDNDELAMAENVLRSEYNISSLSFDPESGE